jgi:hypothetical protein
MRAWLVRTGKAVVASDHLQLVAQFRVGLSPAGKTAAHLAGGCAVATVGGSGFSGGGVRLAKSP